MKDKRTGLIHIGDAAKHWLEIIKKQSKQNDDIKNTNHDPKNPNIRSPRR